MPRNSEQAPPVHLKDYVWMQRGKEAPIQVPATEEAITQHCVAGFLQVDEPTNATPEVA